MCLTWKKRQNILNLKFVVNLMFVRFEYLFSHSISSGYCSRVFKNKVFSPFKYFSLTVILTNYGIGQTNLREPGLSSQNCWETVALHAKVHNDLVVSKFGI